jgi:hypothetical protein
MSSVIETTVDSVNVVSPVSGLTVTRVSSVRSCPKAVSAVTRMSSKENVKVFIFIPSDFMLIII